MIENNQAIEMTNIYRNIIDSTRALVSAVMDSRLNNVIKYLTSITLVMAIPTIISGFFGMNVPMEFANNVYGFGLISIGTIPICIVTLLILRKKNML